MSTDYCYICMCELKNETCPDCSEITIEQNSHHLKPGSILKEKYLVGHPIGAGGFGVTYIGRDILLDIRIAIKEYFPTQFSIRNTSVSPEVTATSGVTVTANKSDSFQKFKDRFLDEARILARFDKDAGIVNVKDYFEANNTAYIVMEYVDGLTLKEHLEQNSRFSSDDIVTMMRPLMESLSRVHEQGLLHRDISPDNIKMPTEGNLKLLDFGAARFVSVEKTETASMTKAGYAPEEQYRSDGKQGPWSDIYALCATMYKCITEVTPPDAITRLTKKIDSKPDIDKPSALGINIKPELEDVILKGMSVRQEDRYQTIPELIAAIDESTGKEGEEVQNVEDAEQEPSDSHFITRKSIIRAILLTGLGVAAILVAFLFITRLSSPADTPVNRLTEEMLPGDWVTRPIGGENLLISFSVGGTGLYFDLNQSAEHADGSIEHLAFAFYWSLFDDETIHILFPLSPWQDDYFEYIYTSFAIEVSDDGVYSFTMFRQVFDLTDQLNVWTGTLAEELFGTWALTDRTSLPSEEFYSHGVKSFESFVNDEITLFPNGTGSVYREDGGIRVFRWYTLMDNKFIFFRLMDIDLEYDYVAVANIISVDDSTLTVFERDGTVLTYERLD